MMFKLIQEKARPQKYLELFADMSGNFIITEHYFSLTEGTKVVHTSYDSGQDAFKAWIALADKRDDE